MRRSSGMALVFMMLTCGGPSSGPGEQTAPTDSAHAYPAIVFLGDSLTAGFGLPADLAFPAQIEAKIRAEGLPYRVVNAGRSGDTTAGGLDRLDWYLEPDVKASIFVIGLGSNDAMRGIELAAIEANLREIVHRIRKGNAKAKILLFSMKTFPSMGRRYAGAYERMFVRVARAEKIVLLPFPLRRVAAQSDLNQSDGIHPNEEGARIVADTIWKDMRPHL